MTNSTLHDPMLLDGRYRLDVKLGAGAFGSVYKAIQVVLGQDLRSVALKVFSGDAVTAANVGEVMNDAIQILALISHAIDWEIRQHFLTVFDLGMTRGPKPQAYISMELVTGGSLENRLSSLGRFTVPGTFHYLRQIARALAFMHEHQFVHSDLKPANVLVFRGPECDLVKIGDFGLAGKYLGPFAAGPRGGTMSYLAPEAIGGFATTPACDVFSLGVLAYELLLGKNPYASVGKTLVPEAPDYQRQLNDLHLKSREIPLSLDRRNFPELTGDLQRWMPLLDVINKMLATDLTQRYSSAKPLLSDLERIGCGRLPELAASATSTVAPPRTVDRHTELTDRFGYLLARGEWAAANELAGETIRKACGDPLGYQLRARLLRRQADELEKEAGPTLQTGKFRAQAVDWLRRALNCSLNETVRRLVRNEMADVYQEMGDHETAQQVRHREA